MLKSLINNVDLLPSIPSAMLASGSALALLATVYLCHRSRQHSASSPSTSITDLAELRAEHESQLRVQAKKYAALASENAELKESQAAYRKENFAKRTKGVQLVSEAHSRTEERLRGQTRDLEEGSQVLETVVEGYAADVWALKRENRELVAKNAELETGNRDLLAMMFDGSEDGADEGVVAENAKLKAQNTRLEAQNTDLEAQNTHLRGRNTELLTHDAETEAENIELQNRNTALRSLNTELVSKTDELENELATPHNAALSENKALHASLREVHKAVQRADKRYISGVAALKDLIRNINEERRTELDKKDKEITTLHTNLTLKAANEAMLQKQLRKITAERRT